MSTVLDAREISSVYGALLAPEQWPDALRQIVDLLDAPGAGYVIRNKRRDVVDWACFVGPLGTRSADYLDYYSKIDIYQPRIVSASEGVWCRLSHCLTKEELRHSEWYNDFMLKAGVDDVMGIKLHDGPTHSITFGFGKSIESRFERPSARLLREIGEHLMRAAHIQYQLRSLGWKSMMTMHALDRLAVGVILVDGESRVMEMSSAAERVLAANDGLILRGNKLGARRSFEAAKLHQLISIATREKHGATAGRMVVARRDGKASCALTIVPVDARLTIPGRSAAMVLLVDSGSQSPSGTVLSEIYGLSPAETRLAAALMTGKPLDAIAAETGVRITTLRTQLSSVLRKVGVKRQADLIRVLSGIHIID